MAASRKPILTAAVAALIALAAAELTLRVTLPPLGESVDAMHPMAGWAFADAFCAYRARPNGTLGRGKSVTAEGYISTPPIRGPKRPGVLRVAFLGGSSTACTVPPLADDETWPWIAATSLEERLGREVEFVNAALPGYSTFESYGRLWSRLRFFEPDLVLVYHGWNDLYYFADARSAERWRTLPDGDWSFSKPSRYRLVDHHPIDDAFGFSMLLRRAARVLWPVPADGEVGLERDRLASDFDPRGPELFRQNLQLMLAAQDVLGFELLVARQATLIVDGLSEELRAKCKYRLHGFDHDAHVRAFDAIYAVIDAEVPAEQVVDCSSLSGIGPCFVDHVHLSAHGARELAGLIVPRLEAAVHRRSAAAPAGGR